MQAVLCPVCSGKGISPPQGAFSSYTGTPCHGCKGKGWVEVSDDIEQFSEPQNPLSPTLIKFYEKKGYNACPTCGGDRNASSNRGCPRDGHYGDYCEVNKS